MKASAGLQSHYGKKSFSALLNLLEHLKIKTQFWLIFLQFLLRAISVIFVEWRIFLSRMKIQSDYCLRSKFAMHMADGLCV